jgi:hypothetical protein
MSIISIVYKVLLVLYVGVTVCNMWVGVEEEE